VHVCDAVVCINHDFFLLHVAFANSYKNIGSLKVVQTKVIPLLLANFENEKLAFQVAKLLVMLTLPAQHVVGRQLEDRILVDYGACLAANPAAISIFVSQLPLDPSQPQTEKSTNTMELVLTLFRNLLAIPNAPMSGVASDSRAQVHEQLLVAFDNECVLSTISEMATLVEFPRYAEWNLLLLELMYLVFVGHTPESVDLSAAAPGEESVHTDGGNTKEEETRYSDRQYGGESTRRPPKIDFSRSVEPEPELARQRASDINPLPKDPFDVRKLQRKGARHSRFGGVLQVR